MKRCLIALFILLASVVAPAQTKITFDKFKNVTHFMGKETQTDKVTYDGGKDISLLIHRMGVVPGFSCEGQVESCKPAGVELLFIAYTSDWEMKGRQVVNLLIDGKPATAGKADWDGQVLGADNLVEYNDTTIAPELLIQLAEAKTVEVQIGLFEFSLTDANLASIRDIAAHMGWLPESIKKAVIEDNDATKKSAAAAASLAQDGHLITPQEQAELLQKGQASKTGVVTVPVAPVAPIVQPAPSIQPSLLKVNAKLAASEDQSALLLSQLDVSKKQCTDQTKSCLGESQTILQALDEVLASRIPLLNQKIALLDAATPQNAAILIEKKQAVQEREQAKVALEQLKVALVLADPKQESQLQTNSAVSYKSDVPISDEKLDEMVRGGKASDCAIVTSPAGAEIDIDGQMAGNSPVAFTLIRHEAPRVITVKMAGYVTMERKVVPDGQDILLGLQLEQSTQLSTTPLIAQNFKGHHIGETATEFLLVEPVIQAKLRDCQANAPKELTAEEIKKRFGKKVYQDYLRRVSANNAAYGGNPPSRVVIMDKDADLYGESCGSAIDALVNGTGRIDGIGFERHNRYWANILKRTSSMSSESMSLDEASQLIQVHYDINERQFYFQSGLLASFSLNLVAGIEVIKNDISSRLGVQPTDVSVPMHNAFGARWSDVTSAWDTEKLHVTLTQNNNPAEPSLPRLSVESHSLYTMFLERRKAAPSPLD